MVYDLQLFFFQATAFQGLQQITGGDRDKMVKLGYSWLIDMEKSYR